MSCQRHISMALHHSRCIWADTFFPGICPLLSCHAVQLIQADNSGNIAIGRPAVGRIHLFYFHRHTKTNASNGQQQENFITFGNLSLSLQEACFYNEQQEKLKLTPMQYTLMEMFYLSSSHLLSIRHLPIAMAGKRQCRRNALHIDTASEAHCRGQQQPQNNNRSWPRLRTGNKNLNIIES